MDGVAGMSLAEKLVCDCLKAGISLAIEDGDLVIKGPYHSELFATLGEHKAAVIKCLQAGKGFLWAVSPDWQLWFEPGTPLHVQEAIARRVLPPAGWPSDLELPWWWTCFALTEDVLEAREWRCECGFGALVRTQKRPEWFCPQCQCPPEGISV